MGDHRRAAVGFCFFSAHLISAAKKIALIRAEKCQDVIRAGTYDVRNGVSYSVLFYAEILILFYDLRLPNTWTIRAWV